MSMLLAPDTHVLCSCISLRNMLLPAAAVWRKVAPSIGVPGQYNCRDVESLKRMAAKSCLQASRGHFQDMPGKVADHRDMKLIQTKAAIALRRAAPWQSVSTGTLCSGAGFQRTSASHWLLLGRKLVRQEPNRRYLHLSVS